MKHTRTISVSEHVNQVLNDISRRMGGGVVRVGFLEGATYPDGTPVAAVAFWNEFGHGGRFPSPPRSFFRSMVAEKSPGWGPQMAALVKAYNYDGNAVLKAMGEIIVGDLRESIIKTNDPPLAESTLILRAKFWTNPGDITQRDVASAVQAAADGKGKPASGTQAKPLVWTGHLLASTGYEVVRG